MRVRRRVWNGLGRAALNGAGEWEEVESSEERAAAADASVLGWASMLYCNGGIAGVPVGVPATFLRSTSRDRAVTQRRYSQTPVL
jgi:hypothetical protein